MAKIEELAENLDLKNAIITSIIASLGFVTALFWRDAIKETIEVIVPEGEGLIYGYLAALGTTLLVIIVIFVLVKMQKTQIRQTLKQTIKKEEPKKK